MVDVTPEKAWIFRITHIDNVAWVLEHGLHCRNCGQSDPNYREIGNPELIGKRAGRAVEIPPGGTLSDYIPFYFTPHSPMLLNIKTGHGGVRQTPMDDIAIVTTSLHQIAQHGIPFVFTDRHAYLQAARFSSSLDDLNWIDWPLLRSRNFQRSPDDPGRFERYQAEALIHQYLPVSALMGVACYNPAAAERVRRELERLTVSLKVAVIPSWYF
ncbi:DUF4433 domain-containing protein [Planctellipticum variicoloris]|uniref:type II toxin-antitoxin system toxin DNA ADP-ribosyl transferase DarT n=1 Tax=Planctellipticum variicoloris TaxID=3064265 RepID=UPI0030134AD4|nr:DUF4433 domain-containing protein [Planctomycetaceae bacterium SH412]